MEMDKNHIEEKVNEYIKHVKWLCDILKKTSDEMDERAPENNSLEFWEQEMQFLAYTINSAGHDLYDVTGDLIEEIDADLEMKYQEKKEKKEKRKTEIIRIMEKAKDRAEAIAEKEPAGAEEGPAAEEPEEADEAAEPEAPTAASDPPSHIDEKELQAAGQH